VPPALESGEPTPGGLVSALLPTLERLERPVWFGWSGESGSRCSGVEYDECSDIAFVRLDLTEAEIDEYYHGFCNQALWPILHGIPERADLERFASADAYYAVNRRFADALVEVLEPGDLVWIHDYHLIPLARELRLRGWSDPIGYFHHVPIPDEDLWATIPDAASLAESFTAYDRIGVQTEADAARLRAIVPRSAAARIGAYPISIDPEAFRAAVADECALPPCDGEADRMLFFGVDRLDYTKAIPQRLEGIEHALETEPRLRSEARFVQWASPSRTAIPEYQAERAAVEAVAERIASRFDDSPLHVEFEAQPSSAVGAALRRADVCVVTSIADGMNLVAKEFAAVHSWDHPGVLVLSDSCGAAEELRDALIFPAGDTIAMSEAIRRAFEMPVQERRARAQALRDVVDTYTCREWGESFIADLSKSAPEPSPARLHRAPDLRSAVAHRLDTLRNEEIIERMWARDHTVWKPEADEIANRLGWLNVDLLMRDQIADLRSFATEIRAAGFTTILLLGMGGSSLAPRVFSTTVGRRDEGLDLVVLSSTVPDEIRAAEQRIDPGRTLYIVSSKSGTTIETRALLDYFWERDPRGEQYIAITDAGTPLERLAVERSFRRVFLNPSEIGGRYSALSYFGLVPGALTGIDLDRLLDGAASMRDACMNVRELGENPGARLGAWLGEAALRGRDYLMLVAEPEVEPFAAWLEQLIAESTGKEMTGILPVLGDPRIADFSNLDEDRHLVISPQDAGDGDLADPYRMGAAFFRWEFAVAVIGHILGINPFDQPDVEAAKRAAAELLNGRSAQPQALAPREVLPYIEPDQYVAIQAYLPRTVEVDRRLQHLRVRMQDRVKVPTVVEYGPSLLHSTGQYHKGGPGRGAFIQLVDPNEQSLSIPRRDYSFNELRDAQAAGDRIALAKRECPVALGTLDELDALV
jgi:trehalose-6-phosphate synthase